MIKMRTQTIIAIKMFLILTVITGVIYPLFVTGIAHYIFNNKANGSLVKMNGIIVGSELIGQKFDSSVYFWSRPSATGYNPLPSGGSNLGPTSEKLKKQISEARTKFVSENMVRDSSSVPLEMITSSASGLDPHISLEAALLQVERVCKARNFNDEQKSKLIALINEVKENPQFSVFGELRINVFKLNLELNDIK